MVRTIAIVDRGRGPQLSTSRITVQDLVPYFQRSWTYEQIIEAVPVLTVEEIQVIERYVQDNCEAVMEEDRRIRERAEARRLPLEAELELRAARRKRLDEARESIRRLQERNGHHAPG
jgi:uncharacterized protein (DUF433 family)